jgi:microcin C transport system permease protein
MALADRLTPINARRLASFRANRRGAWSLVIFLILFGVSLVAELIANDRPILIVYKGEVLSPLLTDYPEEKFGGFLPQTQYRDPVIQEEIEAHGFMIWPPIRYSYNTPNNEIPDPAPAKPSWMYSK